MYIMYFKIGNNSSLIAKYILYIVLLNLFLNKILCLCGMEMEKILTLIFIGIYNEFIRCSNVCS